MRALRPFPVGLAVALSFAAGPALAQWDSEKAMTALGGDVWGEGVATSGRTVHLIYGTNEVRYRRSADEGATWTSEARVGSGTLHLTDPIVADGNDVWIVELADMQTQTDWCCARDLGNIYVQRSRDGGTTWDPPVRLTTARGAFRVSIAYAAGRLHLVWMDYRSGAWDTYYRRSIDRGATWEPEVRLAQSMGTFGAERPQIAALGDSVHVTIWDDRGANPSCMASILFASCPDALYMGSRDGGLSWSAELSPTSAGAAFAGRNDIAVATPSSVILNYNRDVDGQTGQKMFVVRSTDDGRTWGTPVQLTSTPGESDHGSIIGFGSTVHLAWHDGRDPGNLEVYYRASTDSGATWLPEEHVSSGAAGDSSTPLLAVSPGYVHAVWIDNRGGSFQIYYRRRPLQTSGAAGAGGAGGGGGSAGGSGGSADGGAGGDAGGAPIDAGADAAPAGDAGSGGTGGTAGFDASSERPAPSISDGGCGCATGGAGVPARLCLFLVAVALKTSRKPRRVSARDRRRPESHRSSRPRR